MNQSPPPADRIDAEALCATAGLGTFEHLPAVASTMDRARELAAEPGCRLPAVVVADGQTSGRGRQGAGWWQFPGSLATSVVVDPGVFGARAPPTVWSLACGVAVAESVAALAPPLSPSVRWPNDVEVAGRKLAGILVETAARGRVIFGVGVNTTGSARDAPPPLDDRVVTLPDLTGVALPRHRLLAEFLPRLFGLLAETATDPRGLLPRYRPRCSLDGQPVTVHRGGDRVAGICRGIAADGALIIDTPDGRVHVTSGSLTDPADVWRGV
jgi:BirA family biotin operon repressor/biotin-[acetyl-CoA-carboxylase] ligase